MASILVRSNFQDIFDNLLPAIDAVYMQAKELDETDAPWEKLFSMKKSSRQFENLTGFSGFGQFQTVGEGEDIPVMDIAQLHDKKFTHTKWAGAWQVTEEMEDDDKYELVSGLAKAFSRSFRFTKEVNFANVFNNSFSTETAADGVAILGTHVLESGSSIANTPGSVDFGVSAAQTAFNHFATLTDDKGIRAKLSPAYLIGSPANRWLFNEIMGSQFMPRLATATSSTGSDMNAINVLNETNLEIILWAELTDDDAWWFSAKPDAVNGWGLRGYNRQPFTTSTDFDIRNLTMVSVARGRWSRGCYDWRQLYGSAGSG